MEEQRILKKHFFMHILYNMVAFAVIFTFFGMFMFAMIRNITFSAVDNQLREAQNKFYEQSSTMVSYEMFEMREPEFIQEMDTDENGDHSLMSYHITRKIINPQISLILRNEQGEILNEKELGRIGDFKENIEFDKENLNTIYRIKVNNRYNYRCLNFVVDSSEDSEQQYIQLLINVDSEIALINNYLKIIINGIVFGIFISAIASLILSRKTLMPVQDILKKQTEFVQNASHELRTPLTIIQAKQELLLQEPNAKIIDKSEDIMLTLNETKRLSKMTKDLMMLVRGSDTKEMMIQKEDIFIDELIQNLAQPYIEMAESQNKKLLLDLKFQKDAGVDTNKIHQLLVILLDNAIKYTEERR